ncbi:hypothetical protein FEM48_Zijuj09G0033500 [Ziziphus jujuba var. spinosa]|uniref:RING-type domain-containing protein n=1 Tax=Ziziphus jujuba var. spinosa TaxID=714518 RepID=A0A978UQL5_ZIZJJ|nr:hypothetical protein FEM48_Zijuj09G0033500 [Ziziphus jujuba var. spinosa]
MVDNGGSESSQGSGLMSLLDEGSKNKRKLADPSLEKATNLPSSLTEFLPYGREIPPSSLSAFVSMEVGLDRPKVKKVVGAFECADWDDPITCQLEELIVANLQAIFHSAVKQISEGGCSEEEAEKTILRAGLYGGVKDPVSYIINETVSFMKKARDVDALKDTEFNDLQHLAEYTLLEMISVLREVKPSLSVGEAMWLLLICDLNVLQACVLEGDSLSDFGYQDSLEESSYVFASSQLRSESQSYDTIQPNPNKKCISKPSMCHTANHSPETLKFGSFANLPKANIQHDIKGRLTQERENLASILDRMEKYLGTTSQTSASEEKSGAGRKGCSKKEIAVLRQKSFHVERSYRAYGSKGAFRSGKLGSFGGFVVEKRLKPPSELPGGPIKIGSSRVSAEVTGNASITYGKRHASTKISSAPLERHSLPRTSQKGTVCSLPSTRTKLCQKSNLENKPSTAPSGITCEHPKIRDYCAGISYDKSLRKFLPVDEKDELILKLVPRLQELQNELHGWTEWANKKVMQAACRLSKKLPELKILKQVKEEADEFGRVKQMMEENTTKRLSEMEQALNNATVQVEIANSTVCRLEVENSRLRRELETAKLKVLESVDSYREALEREQKALKQARSWEGQKGSLQEELQKEKCKVAALQQDLGNEINIYHQIEARWKQNRLEKEKLLAQAASIRNEREQYEVLAKSEKDMIKQNAAKDIQKCNDDIRKLENKLSEMTLKYDKSKITALKRGATGSFGSCLPDIKTMKENQSSCAFKKVLNFQGEFGNGDLKRERECALCLSDEISVVFIPCAHQVVCTKCNEHHEKQGMKDCPSCRTLIQRRINVRYAHS